MITGFKVYHGLEKSRFQNHTLFFVIPFLRYAQFFYMLSKTESAGLGCVQWRENESHGPSPSCWCEAASSQWESPVFMMMAEGDESLQKSAVWKFFPKMLDL